VGNDKQPLTADQVVQYLTEHSDFFLEQPNTLEILQLNDSPEGTISLAQRQFQRLQNKNTQLQDQLHALIDNARQNSELQSRVHQLCLTLMDAQSLEALFSMLTNELKQEFKADEIALRLFYVGNIAPTMPETSDNISQIHADDVSLLVFDGLFAKQQPVCGRLTNTQKTVLFAEQADKVQSVSCVPLGHEPCVGLLAIASYDANRFHADMATDYLSFLGGIIKRLLRPYTHHQNDE
jgi:uncharacterized protein YigA (DUF484 family)